MKSLPEPKVRYSFPKNVKLHFCPVFWVILWFYPQFHCKIYVWSWWRPNLIFSYSDKLQIPKILSTLVFVGPKVLTSVKCKQNFKILLLAWTLTPNISLTKCLRFLIFAQTIVFHAYFIEITTVITIWLQLNHNSSSDLLKNFCKLNFLWSVSYHYGFFKKADFFFKKIKNYF